MTNGHVWFQSEATTPPNKKRQAEVMHAQSTFEALTDSGAVTSPNWEGALARMFRVCRELVTSMNIDIRAGLLPTQFCARSNVAEHAVLNGVSADLQVLMDAYPIELHSPFEGVSTISGGIWKAATLHESNSADALLKLRFLAGTTDLLECSPKSDPCVMRV